jgi:hypothetical protein
MLSDWLVMPWKSTFDSSCTPPSRKEATRAQSVDATPRIDAKTSNKERLSAMKAQVGDWLVIKGTTVARPDQRGLITEVRSADGSPPYVVRWQATSHVATVFPGPDALVVTSEELEIADARTRARTHA